MSQKPKFAQKKKTDADSFVAEAEHNENLRPWEQPDIKENETKKKMLYLPQESAMKVEYLSERTGIPQQRIMRDILLPGIEDKLSEYEEKGTLKLTYSS